MNRGIRRIAAACGPHLGRTAVVAVVVGTVLTVINQLDVLLAGRATDTTWLKIGLTYLVPFLVSNYGILTATRSVEQDGSGSASRRSPPG